MNAYGKCLLSLLSLGLILSVSKTVAQDAPATTQDTPAATQDTTTPAQDAPAAAQNAPRKALVVNGKTIDAAVVQVAGRSYVDIEGLAQTMGGSVTFEPNQITLTIPGPPPAAAPENAPENAEGMSKAFQQIAVFSLAEMREWRGAIGTVITTGIPVVGTWSQDYHDRIDADLMQATLAASTDSDHQALELLQNEYVALTVWANKVLDERKSLDASRNIDPNSLQSDQSLATISKCSQFLSSMIVSGTFSDDLSCH